MKVLNYDEAHEFVETKKNAFWDGWDIVILTRNSNGSTNQRGCFKNGKWWLANRFKVTNDGTWRITKKYAN